MAPAKIRQRTFLKDPKQIGSVRRLRPGEDALAKLGKEADVGKTVLKALAPFLDERERPVEVDEIGRAQRVLRSEIPDSEFDFTVFGIRVSRTRKAGRYPVGDSDEIFGGIGLEIRLGCVHMENLFNRLRPFCGGSIRSWLSGRRRPFSVKPRAPFSIWRRDGALWDGRIVPSFWDSRRISR